MRLMAIPGKSGQEGQVAAAIRSELRKAGAPANAIRTDQAHRKTPLGGEIGNLVLQLPGTLRGPRRLLMAHMDTVPLCVGSRPKRIGGEIRSANPATGLGADDRAGCAVVLSSHLLHMLEEVCTHVLILKRGSKVANGTLGEVAAQFSNGEAGVDLEEVFIRATGGTEK